MKTQQSENQGLTALVHNKLKDIADVQPLQTSDQNCLNEIKQILTKYGNQEKFGITLLHKHFDLQDNEMMVETINEKDRILTIQPVSIEQAKRIGLVQTVWSFSDDPVFNRDCESYCPTNADGSHYGYRDHY